MLQSASNMGFSYFLSLLRTRREQIDRIERLLYDFPVPFDKEQARKNLKYGRRAKLSPILLAFFQKQLLELLTQAIDTIVSLHEQYGDKFNPPLQRLAINYFLCNLYLKDMEVHLSFPRMYKIDIHSFSTIEGDMSLFVKDWHEQKSKIINHIAELKKFLYLNHVTEYKIPFRLESFIDSLRKSIEQQKEVLEEKTRQEAKELGIMPIISLPVSSDWDRENNNLFLISDRHKLPFSRNSNIKAQFETLVANNRKSKYVKNKEIQGQLGISYDALRSNMDDIKKMIKNKGLSHVIKVIPSGKGSYGLSYIYQE